MVLEEPSPPVKLLVHTLHSFQGIVASILLGGEERKGLKKRKGSVSGQGHREPRILVMETDPFSCLPFCPAWVSTVRVGDLGTSPTLTL